MFWIMVYVTVAITVLSLVGACFARGTRKNPGRLVAMIATAALWPVVAVGLVQFGAVQLWAAHVNGSTHTPVLQAMAETNPASIAKALVDVGN
jgi:hypothetical protein